MTCLLKRALPLIVGLAVGISLVSLFKAAARLTSLQPALSTEVHKLDIPPLVPSRLTFDESEKLLRHSIGGLCYSHGNATEVFETIADSRITTKAKILYLPEPSSWEKQHPCSQCLALMRATLDASGKVTNVEPKYTRSLKYIDSDVQVAVNADAQCKGDVLKAVAQIRFEPAMKDGEPVSQLVTIIYDKWGQKTQLR